MENRRRFVIEAIIGFVFVVLLILSVVLVTGLSKAQSSNQDSVEIPKTTNTITNSYNTYNYNDGLSQVYREDIYDDFYYDNNHRYENDRARVYYYDDYRMMSHEDRYLDRNYGMHHGLYEDPYNYDYYDSDYNNRYKDSFEEYLDYSSDSQLNRDKGIFGNKVNNYEVYVRNDEYVGGYFDVTFYFEDYSGKVSENLVREYVPAREEKKFFYRDVSPQRYEYRDWWYEVRSLTEASNN